MQVNLKRYGLYLFRWQLSTPILAAMLYLLSAVGKVTATIVVNLIGGLIFFWVDMFIFTSERLSVEWAVKDTVVCVDCGREARGYPLAFRSVFRSYAVPATVAFRESPCQPDTVVLR